MCLGVYALLSSCVFCVFGVSNFFVILCLCVSVCRHCCLPVSSVSLECLILLWSCVCVSRCVRIVVFLCLLCLSSVQFCCDLVLVCLSVYVLVSLCVFCVPCSVWYGVSNDAIIFGTFYRFWWRHKYLKWAITLAKMVRLSWYSHRSCVTLSRSCGKKF